MTLQCCMVCFHQGGGSCHSILSQQWHCFMLQSSCWAAQAQITLANVIIMERRLFMLCRPPFRTALSFSLPHFFPLSFLFLPGRSSSRRAPSPLPAWRTSRAPRCRPPLISSAKRWTWAPSPRPFSPCSRLPRLCLSHSQVCVASIASQQCCVWTVLFSSSSLCLLP